MFRVLRRFFASTSRPSPRKNQARPRLELLEDRTTPTVVTGIGNDNLVLLRTPGGGPGAITYVLDGAAPVVLTGVSSFTFNGGPGNDTMTVSYLNGTPLLSGGVTFNGGNGSNFFVLDDSAGTIPATMTVSDAQISSRIGDALTSTYTASGTFAALGLLTGSGDDTVGVLGTAAPTTIATGAGNDTVGVVAPSGALGNVLKGVLSVNLGNGTNTLQVAEPANSAGDVIALNTNQFVGEGAQPFMINDAAPGGAFAGVSLTTGLGNDQVGVFGTAGPTGVLTGAGDDSVGVAALSGSLGSVLHGPLSLELGGGANTLGINEANNTSVDVITMTATGFLGQGAQPFLINDLSTGGTFAGVSLTTGVFNDQVNVFGTAGPTGVLTGAGDDSVGVVVLTGSLGSVLNGPLSLDLGPGLNTLGINEANDTCGDVITMTATQFIGTGPQPFLINYQATGGAFVAIDLVKGMGHNVVTVQGCPTSSQGSTSDGSADSGNTDTSGGLNIIIAGALGDNSLTVTDTTDIASVDNIDDSVVDVVCVDDTSSTDTSADGSFVSPTDDGSF